MSSTVHILPGRLRVKIPAIRSNPAMASHVESIIEPIQGIERVKVNRVTGSLKIRYAEDRVNARQLIAILKANGLFDETWVADSEAQKNKVAVQATQALGKAIINWSVGRALEAKGLGIIAAFI